MPAAQPQGLPAKWTVLIDDLGTRTSQRLMIRTLTFPVVSCTHNRTTLAFEPHRASGQRGSLSMRHLTKLTALFRLESQLIETVYLKRVDIEEDAIVIFDLFLTELVTVNKVILIDVGTYIRPGGWHSSTTRERRSCFLEMQGSVEGPILRPLTVEIRGRGSPPNSAVLKWICEASLFNQFVVTELSVFDTRTGLPDLTPVEVVPILSGNGIVLDTLRLENVVLHGTDLRELSELSSPRIIADVCFTTRGSICCGPVCSISTAAYFCTPRQRAATCSLRSTALLLPATRGSSPL